jgi:hypothetical protein
MAKEQHFGKIVNLNLFDLWINLSANKKSKKKPK